jgi:hypothetical protein
MELISLADEPCRFLKEASTEMTKHLKALQQKAF